MKLKLQTILICLFLFSEGTIVAQDVKKEIIKGNEAYKNGDFEAAQELYKNASAIENTLEADEFNFGASQIQLRDFEGAAETFQEIAKSSANKTTKANAFHNLGNALLEQKKYQESANAFKEALKLNPTDEDTRYNYAYAKKMLQEQQKQEEQNKDQENQDQDKKDEENKDENKDQKDENKDKNNQENQDKDENKDSDQNQDQKDKDEEKQDGKDENKDDKNQDKEPQEQQQQHAKPKLSKADAERMLKANENQEKETQAKLRKKQVLKGDPKKIEKNW